MESLRAASFFAFDDSHAASMLALLPVYARLPSTWRMVGGLGERRPTQGSKQSAVVRLYRDGLAAAGGGGAGGGGGGGVEDLHGADGISAEAAADSAGAADSEAAAAAGSGARVVVHFRGRYKPWIRDTGSGALCVFLRGESESPCAVLWSRYASHAARTVGWKRPSATEAARASADAVAAAVAGAAEDAEPLGPPPLEADPLYAAPGASKDGEEEDDDDGDDGHQLAGAGASGERLVHVAVASSDPAPYGLMALVNSTFIHAKPATRPRLRVHVLARDATHAAALSAKLRRAFPPSRGRSSSSSVGSPTASSVRVHVAPAERLVKLKSRLTQLSLSIDPFNAPQLWLAGLLLEAEVPRVLLLSESSLVLTDVGELYAAVSEVEGGSISRATCCCC